ncbi:MAG: hypothetical protein F6J98_37090, partial [Moorea sp. SIO4G2]|nr:hypothetical protein [Moorena sp. SIO4G2]
LYVDVHEEGVAPSLCVERRQQYVWRIIDGKARYIGYRLFASLKGDKELQSYSWQ